jgi:hypothetical protein
LSALCVGSHFDEQGMPLFQNAKGNTDGFGDCCLLLLIERVSGVSVPDLAAKPQA